MNDGRRVNPYVGLRPYLESDSLWFFGRREQTAELLEALNETRFIAVVGSSGCGKSSLVRAGLVPALKAGFLVQDRDRWAVARMKPGTAPMANLAAGLVEAFGPEADRNETAGLLEALRNEHADALVDYVRPRIERTSLLLIVDQFEEVFGFRRDPDTTAGEGPAGRRRAERKAEADQFVDILLRAAARTDLPIYVVITMRSDYLGDCDIFYGLPEALNRGRYLVPRLTREQLRAAIEGPALLAGGRIAPRLLDDVLNRLGDRFDQLPVLQHALQRTWAEWVRQGRQGPIDLRHFEGIGGLDDALSIDAEDAARGLDPAVLAAIFKRLTAVDSGNRRIRDPARVGELAAIAGVSKDAVLTIVRRFHDDGRNFLFESADGRPDDPVIDISHESLIRQWPRLRDWVDEERASRDRFQELLGRAEAHGRGEASLLANPDLQLAIDWRQAGRPTEVWAARYGGSLGLVSAYIDASRKREAERVRNRRLGVATAMLIAVAVITFVIRVRIESLNATIAALSDSNTDLNGYVNVLTARNNELRLTSANLTADIDSLSNEIPALRESNASLDNRLVGMREDSGRAVSMLDDVEERLAGVQRTVAARQSRLDSLENRQRTLAARLQHLIGTTRSLDLGAPYLVSWRIIAPSAVLPNVQMPAGPPPPDAIYIERLRVTVDSLRLENRDLRDRVRILLANNDSLDARIAEQRDQHEALAFEADSLRTRNIGLREDFADLEAWLSSTWLSIGAREGDISLANQTLSSVATEIDQVDAGIDITELSIGHYELVLGSGPSRSTRDGFARLIAESTDSVMAGVLAATMVRLDRGPNAGAFDPRLLGGLRNALARLGGTTERDLAAGTGAVAVGSAPDGLSLALARSEGGLESVSLAGTAGAPAGVSASARTTRRASVTFSPNGRLAAVVRDGELRLFMWPDRSPVPVSLPAAIEPAGGAAFVGDSTLAFGHADGVAIWRIGSGNVTPSGACAGDTVTAIATAPAAGLLACAKTNGSIDFWDTDSDTLRTGMLPVCTASPNCQVTFTGLALSADGTRLAGTAEDGSLRVWNAAAPALLLEFRENTTTMRTGPVATVIERQSLTSTENPDGSITITANLSQPPFTSLSFTLDGQQIVTADRNGRVRIYELSPDSLGSAICARLPANVDAPCTR